MHRLRLSGPGPVACALRTLDLAPAGPKPAPRQLDELAHTLNALSLPDSLRTVLVDNAAAYGWPCELVLPLLASALGTVQPGLAPNLHPWVTPYQPWSPEHDALRLYLVRSLQHTTTEQWWYAAPRTGTPEAVVPRWPLPRAVP